jgi:hypothetical protein
MYDVRMSMKRKQRGWVHGADLTGSDTSEHMREGSGQMRRHTARSKLVMCARRESRACGRSPVGSEIEWNGELGQPIGQQTDSLILLVGRAKV